MNRFYRPAAFHHGYPFDPAYGMTLDDLLDVDPPAPPADFESFWRRRAAAVAAFDPSPMLWAHHPVGDLDVVDVTYRSTDDHTIGGWLVRPRHGPITRGLVVGHGYGGRDGPDLDMAFPETAVLFPCMRGLSRSACSSIAGHPDGHVLHGIDHRDTYVLGGCVDDLWLAVSALLTLFPETAGRIGWSGRGFGGGIGALALPWETRVARAELIWPTFGHHGLRRRYAMTGSGAALNARAARDEGVMRVLAYFDAASAARHIRQPVLAGLALFDPAVPPPGQFAIYNALDGEKELVTFDAGHFDYPQMHAQERQRLARSRAFFGSP